MTGLPVKMDSSGDSDARNPHNKFNSERDTKKVENNNSTSHYSSSSTSSSSSSSSSETSQSSQDDADIYTNPKPSGSGLQNIEITPTHEVIPSKKHSIDNNEEQEKRSPKKLKQQTDEEPPRRYFQPSPFDCPLKHVGCKNPHDCRVKWERKIRLSMLTRKTTRNETLTEEERRFVRSSTPAPDAPPTSKTVSKSKGKKLPRAENRPTISKKRSKEKRQGIRMERLMRRICREFYNGKKNNYDENKIIKEEVEEVDLTQDEKIIIQAPIVINEESATTNKQLESVKVDARLEDIVVSVPFSMPLVNLGEQPTNTIQTNPTPTTHRPQMKVRTSNQIEINPAPVITIPTMAPGTSKILQIRVSKNPVTESIPPKSNQDNNTNTTSESKKEATQTEPPAKEVSYKCDKCKRLFKNKSNLTRHTMKNCKN